MIQYGHWMGWLHGQASVNQSNQSTPRLQVNTNILCVCLNCSICNSYKWNILKWNILCSKPTYCILIRSKIVCMFIFSDNLRPPSITSMNIYYVLWYFISFLRKSLYQSYLKSATNIFLLKMQEGVADFNLQNVWTSENFLHIPIPCCFCRSQGIHFMMTKIPHRNKSLWFFKIYLFLPSLHSMVLINCCVIITYLLSIDFN